MSELKRFLKMFSALICAVSVLLLSGCSDFDLSADNFLAPPRAGGEMYDIEQALENSVTVDYTLKYPTAGEYRSAYVLADLMKKDEKNFAIAFYSTVGTDNVSSMHLNLMKKVDDKWISISDVSVSAGGVEKVEFSDLDGDGVKEIVVGWNIYGGMDKTVSVYELQGKNLAVRLQSTYTSFLCCDLGENGRDDLFLLTHKTNTAQSDAKLYSFEKENVREVGSCALDGTVSSFNEPVISKLSTGTSAVYIDGVKGTGMQTEIVYYKGKELVAPLAEANMMGTAMSTYRDTSVACMDINSDGFLDVPIIAPFDNFDLQLDETTLNPITKWCIFDGTKFSVAMYAVMNYTDGYYFEIPHTWQNRITVGMNIESRLRTVYLWNVEEGSIISELVRIRAVSQSEWDKEDNGFNGYVEITRSEGVVYAAMLSGYEGVGANTIDELKEAFYIIG